MLRLITLDTEEAAYANSHAGPTATTELSNRSAETEAAISGLLDNGYDDAITKPAEHALLSGLPPLEPTMCPEFTEDDAGLGRKGVCVEVRHAWPLDAAVMMEREWDTAPGGRLVQRSDPVLVLNIVDKKRHWHTWTNEDIGPEEEMALRTTVLSSLAEGANPDALPVAGGNYTRIAAIIRKSRSEGHQYEDLANISYIDRVSILSMGRAAGNTEELRSKWRFVLRLAITKYHCRIVLGVFSNDRTEYALKDEIKAFKDVVSEPEFKRGWFEKVTFAVSGADYEVVHEQLHNHFF